MFVQKEYNKGHGRIIEWVLCRKLRFEHTDKRYEHEPNKVSEGK